MLSLSVALLICSGRLQGEDASTALSRDDVEKIVREYILQHPEVLMESVQAHRERERLEAQRRSKGPVEANRRELFEDATSPVNGRADADITIVQFFDYKCGYCRRVTPTLSTLLEKHRNVKVIFKELPILGAESHMASRAALAAAKQGAYLPFHHALMNLNGPVTPEIIESTGRKLGLDVARLKTDMSSKEVDDILTQNQRLAGAIGVQSTPSFVVGNELISGAMDLPRFEELISRAGQNVSALQAQAADRR
jgi:protein-disulfide isomerase